MNEELNESPTETSRRRKVNAECVRFNK